MKKYKLGDVIVDTYYGQEVPKQKIRNYEEHIHTQCGGFIVLPYRYVFILKDVKVNTVTKTHPEKRLYTKVGNFVNPQWDEVVNVVIGIYECVEVKELEPVKLTTRELNNRFSNMSYSNA